MPTLCPPPAQSADGPGMGWGVWGDINIYIDINMSSDIHIIINMNQILLAASIRIFLSFVRHAFLEKGPFRQCLSFLVNLYGHLVNI